MSRKLSGHGRLTGLGWAGRSRGHPAADGDSVASLYAPSESCGPATAPGHGRERPVIHPGCVLFPLVTTQYTGGRESVTQPSGVRRHPGTGLPHLRRAHVMVSAVEPWAGTLCACSAPGTWRCYETRGRMPRPCAHAWRGDRVKRPGRVAAINQEHNVGISRCSTTPALDDRQHRDRGM